jgi:opacity protein-like surface antigen
MSKTLASSATAFAVMAAAASPAFAQSMFDPMPSGPRNYIGVSGGESRFRTDCSSLFSCDKNDTAWKVYAGSGVNDVLGVELGYVDFGKINVNGGDTKAWAGTLSLTAGVPIGDRFKLFAKGGGLYGETDVHASPSSIFDTGHKNGWGYTYGVGAALGITRTVQIRLDWDRHNMDFVGGSKDVDMYSAGVQLRF